jgi:hypothetical protein
MNKISKFFSSMFSGSNDVSSKRFNTFYALTSIIILAFIATFKSADGVTPEFMYDALALIAGGGMGLTVVEKIFNKNTDTAPKQDETPAAPVQSIETQGTTETQCACGATYQSCDKCK